MPSSRSLPALLGALLVLACQSPATRDAAAPNRSTARVDTHGRGADGLGDAYFPRLGNGGYDARHYTVELEVDVEENHVEGRARMSATATEDLASFHLDLSGLEVHSVTVDGAEARHRREDHELVITPARPLDRGVEFEVTVVYSGSPEVIPLGGLPVAGVGWMHEGDRVLTMSEPHGSMSWYPCNNHPRDKATHEFLVDVPADYTVAANGALQSVEESAGRRRFHFRASDPMATYLATVNIAEFEVERQEGPDGLPLTYYFAPETEAEARESFRRTPELIEVLSEWFGPYPFESYGGVVAGGGPPAALETQTLPVYGGANPGIGVQVHELAHQWFGNSVSCDTWRDLWLAEGFASYAEWLWRERENGPEALEERLRRVYPFLCRAEYELAGDPGADSLFGIGVYVRAPLMLHALRLKIGDEAFFDLLQAWTRDHANGTGSAEEFFALAEHTSGRELSEFFQAWLYRAEMPDLPQLDLVAAEHARDEEG